MTLQKLIFDTSFTNQYSFPAAEIDAMTAFFLKNGFDTNSANSITITLLNYAREQDISPFKLLDTLNPLTELQLNDVVLQVLNNKKDKTTLLGYKIPRVYDSYEVRNIVM
jgi:hypothetical protein